MTELFCFIGMGIMGILVLWAYFECKRTPNATHNAIAPTPEATKRCVSDKWLS
jgi:hypothetical protein